MSTRLPDDYFNSLYRAAEDPWELSGRWYDRRKYAITMAMLPKQLYQNAFEPGCSIGTLTELLAERSERVMAIDIVDAALDSADRRLRAAGCRERVTLQRGSLDDPWPVGPFDLVVLSEVAYYLDATTLAAVLRRECSRLKPGTTVVAAHWRHFVAEYPIGGDEANEIIYGTNGLTGVARYVDQDVVIDVLVTGGGSSVAAEEQIPGAS